MGTWDLKKSLRWTITLTLSLNLIFMIKDISDDLREGEGFWHIGPEILVVVGTVVVAILAMVYLLKFKEQIEKSDTKIMNLELANESWRMRTRSYAEGLSNEIDRQMIDWGLSQAEKEIALLLLKGLSNREISSIRKTSEQTIKQQLSNIYRKSNTASRSELSAYFLEDMLTPTI